MKRKNGKKEQSEEGKEKGKIDRIHLYGKHLPKPDGGKAL
jgi:hypothetical protein